MRAIHRFTLAGVAAFSLALLPGTANATPSSGVSATILAQTTVGGKDYILREITIQPGGSTGWHYHDGTLYAVVKEGTLTRTESDCTTNHTHKPGNTIVEPSGADHVHIGRNLGTSPVVLDVLYVNPAGSPLAQDAANPGCSFQ
ncbi:cupin domain-containing protein [Streptomyces capitiformicae]|uniref:Cupin n=1 Tax=Streptomyces capitiformicae TaxID=2014920 RepID=A0A918ZWG6_9ACTN|nr:cupin domain-containing protein [Streptomyces capitiformicae]GHE72494.1 cupin [Streptomyces capitiformicae]